MACSISLTGRALTCYDQLGGIKQCYIAALDQVTPGAYSAGAIGDFGSGDVFKGYKVKYNSSSMTETVTANTEAGTVFFSTTVSLTFYKPDAGLGTEINLLTSAPLVLVVVDNNDNERVVGFSNGAYMSGGTMTTGQALGDAQTYTLEFTAEETKPSPFLTTAIASSAATFTQP